MKTKAFKVFDGNKFTLYKSGSKKDVSDYVKKYGIPKLALHKTIKAEGEYRLYMYFKK